MKIETWHRRQALTLASQLPDDPDDALAVIQAVRELVDFVGSDGPEPERKRQPCWHSKRGEGK
jgi:hypothetical protein